jgi:hypothetical protein
MLVSKELETGVVSFVPHHLDMLYQDFRDQAKPVDNLTLS